MVQLDNDVRPADWSNVRAPPAASSYLQPKTKTNRITWLSILGAKFQTCPPRPKNLGGRLPCGALGTACIKSFPTRHRAERNMFYHMRYVPRAVWKSPAGMLSSFLRKFLLAGMVNG